MCFVVLFRVWARERREEKGREGGRESERASVLCTCSVHVEPLY